MVSKKEILKEWKEYIVNYDAQPGKNSTFYISDRPDIPLRLLTTRCNTMIANLLWFILSICASLTSNQPHIIKDTSHLLDFIDDINKSSLPEKVILASFHILNTFPNKDKKEKWKQYLH